MKRRSMLPLLPAFAAVAVVGAVFPYKAFFCHVPAAARRSLPSCAFVTIDAETETRAMEDVRSTLSVDSKGVREMSADLSVSTIPDHPYESITDVSDRTRPAPFRAAIPGPVPSAPSLAAPEPVAIPDDGKSDPPVFSREELLKPE